MTTYRLSAIRDHVSIVSLDFVPTSADAIGLRTVYAEARAWQDMVEAETTGDASELVGRECDILPGDRIDWHR